MTPTLGQVSRLFRYPVKSMGGEALEQAEVHLRGIEGDRVWAVEDEDGHFGSGKSTRRFRRMDGLLEFHSYYRPGGGTPVLVTPEGLECEATSPEAAGILRSRIGKLVQIKPEGSISHFDEGPLHLVTTSALAALEERHGRPVDVQRLRTNITLTTTGPHGHLEADWMGRRLRIGPEVVIDIAALMPRCVMVNMAQRELPEDTGVLRTIAQMHLDACLGVMARVLQPGTIRLGDAAVFA